MSCGKRPLIGAITSQHLLEYKLSKDKGYHFGLNANMLTGIQQELEAYFLARCTEIRG